MTVDQIIGIALLAFVVGYMAADLLRGGTRGFSGSSFPSHRRPSSGMADESPRIVHRSATLRLPTTPEQAEAWGWRNTRKPW